MMGFMEQRHQMTAREVVPFCVLPAGKYDFRIIQILKKTNSRNTGKILSVYVKALKTYQDSPVMRAAVNCNGRFFINFAHENPDVNAIGREELGNLKAAVGLSKLSSYGDLVGKSFKCRVRMYERTEPDGRKTNKNQFRPIPRCFGDSDASQRSVSGLVDRSARESFGDGQGSRRDPNNPDFWLGV